MNEGSIFGRREWAPNVELMIYWWNLHFLCLLKLIYEIEVIRKPSNTNQSLGILFLQVYSGPLLLLSGLGTGCAISFWISTGGVPPFPSLPYNNP
jgi:hypothetical protein